MVVLRKERSYKIKRFYAWDRASTGSSKKAASNVGSYFLEAPAGWECDWRIQYVIIDPEEGKAIKNQ